MDDDNAIVVHKGNAVAKFFRESKRVILIADDGCFHHAEDALHEIQKRLREENRERVRERVCGCGCGQVESIVLQQISMLGRRCNTEEAKEIFDCNWKGKWSE